MRTPGEVLIDVESFPVPSQALIRRFYTVVRLCSGSTAYHILANIKLTFIQPLARCDRCAQRDEECLFNRWANRCMTCYYDSPASCSFTSIESWYQTFPLATDDVFSHKERESDGVS